MGMSASQARLLSITGRLTNNEFRAQTITNSKLRLAQKSQEASQEYMDALNSQKLVFKSFDSNGDGSYTPLTANSLLSWAKLKNQYALVNSSGQALVDGSDVKNYEFAQYLSRFLYCYDLNWAYNELALTEAYGNAQIDTDNNDELDTNLYDKLYEQELKDPNGGFYYDSSITNITTSGMSTINSLLNKEASLFTASDYTTFTTCVNNWSSGIKNLALLGGNMDNISGSFGEYLDTLLNPPAMPDPNSAAYGYGEELAESFTNASKNCMVWVLGKKGVLDQDGNVITDFADTVYEKSKIKDLLDNGTRVMYGGNEITDISQLDSEYKYFREETRLDDGTLRLRNLWKENQIVGNSVTCYKHILASLLVKPSEFIINQGSDGTQSERVADDWTEEVTTTLGNTINVVANDVNGSAIGPCGWGDELGVVGEYILQDWVYVQEDETDNTTVNSSDLGKLLSNYKFVDDGNGSYTKTLKTFKEKISDLIYLVSEAPDSTAANPKYNYETYGENKWTVLETKLIPQITYFQSGISTSLEKSSYVRGVKNWQELMKNWLDSVTDARNAYIEDLENIPDKSNEKYQWYVNLWNRMGAGATTSSGKKDSRNYQEIDPTLVNNAEWLEFCFEHGILTLEQAQFNEEGSATYSGMGEYDWVSIIYTNASDIVSQEDEVAIAIAEVKYQNRITEIENEDKKFDQDLKKLDTEHTALQTEYDSIKEVISKNVERSFKAFS